MEVQEQTRRRTVVAIGSMLIGAGDPVVIAGPCSVHDPRAALAAASMIALGVGTIAALATTDETGALIGSIAAVALNLIPTSAEGEVPGG